MMTNAPPKEEKSSNRFFVAAVLHFFLNTLIKLSAKNSATVAVSDILSRDSGILLESVAGVGRPGPQLGADVSRLLAANHFLFESFQEHYEFHNQSLGFPCSFCFRRHFVLR